MHVYTHTAPTCVYTCNVMRQAMYIAVWMYVLCLVYEGMNSTLSVTIPSTITAIPGGTSPHPIHPLYNLINVCTVLQDPC